MVIKHMLSRSQENQIIEYYRQGFSREEISNRVEVSTGSVSNIISKWKTTADPDIEEIRQFMQSIRRTGMNLKQCSEGFRMHNLMKKIGIGETGDFDADESKLTKFVNEFYNTCQFHQITPRILVSWFDDLVEFSITILNLDEKNGPDPSGILKRHPELEKSFPLVTLISRTLETKKKEFENLQNKKNNLIEDVKFLKIQKDDLDEEISGSKQEKKHFLSLYDLFCELDYILKEKGEVDLRTDLQLVVNILYGFMNQKYDLKQIFNKYNKATKIDVEIFQNQNHIGSLRDEIARLQNEIGSIKSILNMNSRTLDIYQQLETMKLGLEELKQLRLTVAEIARSRKIDPYDAVSIFIKDVEKNYHDKLLFENRIDEKKKELEVINNQLNLNRYIIIAQPVTGSSMSQLYQNGINEQEIVELVHLFQNSLQEKEVEENSKSQEKTKTGIHSNDIPTKITSWKELAEELKKYKGIKEAVIHETIILNKLNEEHEMIMKESKNLSDLCQKASHLINILNGYYFYFKGYFDQSQYKNIFNIRYSGVLVPLIILALYQNHTNENEENENEKNGSQDNNNDGNM